MKPVALIALLEVMDKAPTVPELWMFGVLLGIGGFFAARSRPWAAVPFVIFQAFGLWSVWGELSDPFVGPAILREAGRNYPLHVYATTGIATVLPLLGAVLRKRVVERAPRQ